MNYTTSLKDLEPLYSLTPYDTSRLKWVRLSEGQVALGNGFVSVKPDGLIPYLLTLAEAQELAYFKKQCPKGVRLTALGRKIPFTKTFIRTEGRGAKIGCFVLTKNDLRKIRKLLKNNTLALN